MADMDSPVSNNGRGLKLVGDDDAHIAAVDSPVSNNGRGLKRRRYGRTLTPDTDSPVSNNGRGLKLPDRLEELVDFAIRPLAITGVD